MKPNPKSDPLAALETLAAREADRRAAQRASNRASFPQIASICDQVKAMFPSAQLLHGEESGREIGKRPTLPPNVVEVDFFKAMELAAMGQPRGRK